MTLMLRTRTTETEFSKKNWGSLRPLRLAFIRSQA